MAALSYYTITRGAISWTVPLIITVAATLIGVKFLQLTLNSNTETIVLMFGVSFYALRIVHLLIEFYLGKLEYVSPKHLQGYLFFPAIIAAGPIQKFGSFKQLNYGSFDLNKFSCGLARILHGTALVMVAHDVLLKKLSMPWLKTVAVDLNWYMPAKEWITCLEYGLSLYLQFSAYSSIAIGFALLLGYGLDENFNWPFLRTSLVKFWRNWHISLSSFCRVYIFTGTLAVSRSVPLAFIASMLAIGMWHSLSLNFIFWGLYHGVGLILTQVWLSSRALDYIAERIPDVVLKVFGWVFTFNYVILGFAFTKHNSLAESVQSWARIFGLE